jgi:glycosyltransferase involved in cell wall biosynthesis
MKIAIDVRMIGDLNHGIARYAYNLIKELSNIDTKNDYVLLSNNTCLNDFVSSRKNFSLKLTSLKLYGIREQVFLPRLLKKEKIDIFHTPSFACPVCIGCKVIMTIHDMIHVLFQENSSVVHKLYYRYIVRKAAEKSSKIITVSECSKRDIINYLNLSPEKVVVTYNAVDRIFKRSNEDDVDKLKERFGINGKFIMYVGNLKPHKNVRLLIEAFQLLRRKVDLKLVIVGINRLLLFQKGLNDKLLEGVIFVGGVPDELMSHFYSGAEIYVSPSLYEGFGLPLIEAIACRTPVVAISSPSSDEILGNAGYLVNENQPEVLANAIYTVLLDSNLRNCLVEKGIERIKQFSWEKSAKKILEIYYKAHSENNLPQ